MEYFIKNYHCCTFFFLFFFLRKKNIRLKRLFKIMDTCCRSIIDADSSCYDRMINSILPQSCFSSSFKASFSNIFTFIPCKNLLVI